MQLARIAVLALALAHAVGFAEQVRRVACEEECRDDGCEDHCGPSEPSCRCHAPAASQLVAPAAVLVSTLDAPIVLARLDSVDRAHASPDPREILHVPRLAT